MMMNFAWFKKLESPETMFSPSGHDTWLENNAENKPMVAYSPIGTEHKTGCETVSLHLFTMNPI